MTIRIQCPNPECSSMYTVDDSVGNQRVRCKRCDTRFVAEPTIEHGVTETGPMSPQRESPFASLPAEFGRYRVLGELGRGGMGCVYRALDKQLGREVALKLPSFGSQDDVRRGERFVHEGKAAAALQHPNICTVYDAGEIDGKPFMAMEFVSGKPLSSWADEVSPNQALEWCGKIASALAHAHQKGIVHRDLKPANVVINLEGEPKLMDFGLAKLIGDSDLEQSKLTHDGAVMGTPSYMSPEQARGDQQSIGPATDIYSLGVLLFELLTGSTPYTGTPAVVMAQTIASPVPNLRDIHPLINENLNGLVRKALAKTPSERFTSAAQMADALRLLVTVPNLLRTSEVPKSSAARKAKQRQANNKRFVIIGTALASLFLLAGILFTLRTKHGDVVIELSDPTAEVSVTVDGEVVSLSTLGKDYKIAVGEHGLKVSGPGFETISQKFTVREGTREVVKVDLKKNPQIASRELKNLGQKSPVDHRDVARKAMELGAWVSVTANGQAYDHLRSMDDLPKSEFTITVVGFWHLKQIEDKDLECLNGVTNLSGIGLDGTSITDAGLKVFDRVGTLTSAGIGGTKVTEKGVESLLLSRPEIREMTVNDIPITDRIMPLFKNCTILWANRTQISDQGLAVFKGRSLKTLILDGTQITDEGLRHFEGTSVQHLVLANTQISDAGLAYLAKMNGIGKIELGGTKVTKAGLEKFQKKFPNCKVSSDVGVIDSNRNKVSETEVRGLMRSEREAAKELIALGASLEIAIADKTENVSSLDALPQDDFKVVGLDSRDMLDQFNDDYVERILSFPNLKKLGLPRCSMTDNGFDQIRQIEQLDELGLYFPSRLTESGLDRFLSRAKSLQNLSLEGAPITDAMLSKLRSLPLENMNLAFTRISDQGIANLSGMKLHLLFLDQTKVTDNSMPTLAESVTGFLRLHQTAITDEGLRHLAGHHLQELGLNDTKVSSVGMRYLTRMESLEELSVKRTQVKDEGLKLILERFPNITLRSDSIEQEKRLSETSEAKPEDETEASQNLSRDQQDLIDALKPTTTVNYEPFDIQKWKSKSVSTDLYPWKGKQIVVLTTKKELNPVVMQRFVQRLDEGWAVYQGLIGRSPNPFKQIDGKATIAAIPDASLTCGYGCGYIGSTGVEVAGFYNSDYPLVRSNPQAFSHYYFYEMGRNFYIFEDRHSLFITGYAVFMRYVCMDALKCVDPDQRTRMVIESCEQAYADSNIPFLKGFTNLEDGLNEKSHRLLDKTGKPISPSDQPVIYAAAMMKLRRDYGGDAWLKRFYEHLMKCPKVKPDSRDNAVKQSMNWLVAASAAAEKDLTEVFVQRWRMPLGKATIDYLSKVDWKEKNLDVASVLAAAPFEMK